MPTVVLHLANEIDILIDHLSRQTHSVQAVGVAIKQLIGLHAPMPLGQAMLVEQLIDTLFGHYEAQAWHASEFAAVLKSALPSFVFNANAGID